MGEFIVGFSAFLDIQTALVVEFYVATHAIKKAQKMGLTSLWLEYDSALVCVAFTTRTNVPWILRNMWKTCLNYYGKIRFRISHIFREGNACVANLGFVHREQFHWYNRLPSSLSL